MEQLFVASPQHLGGIDLDRHELAPVPAPERASRADEPEGAAAVHVSRVRPLGAKLDLILRSNDDPSTVQQLESAIAALRFSTTHAASAWSYGGVKAGGSATTTRTEFLGYCAC